MNAWAITLRCCSRAVLIALLLGAASVAKAEDDHPLRPPDTSSPRATLQGFVAITDDIYSRMKSVLDAYAGSARLYPTAEERRQRMAALAEASKAVRYFDLSRVPPVLLDTVSAERVLQLKEVLDRIEIAPFADIPDQENMERRSAKRWRLPNTGIDIVRIETGPRTGEYLVSAETVDRLPGFYQRVKDLPYKPGAGEQLASAYRKFSNNQSATIYEAFLGSPVGFSFILPRRWLMSLPHWATVPAGGLTAWQWLGLAVGFLIAGLIIWVAYQAARRVEDREDGTEPHWRALLIPVAIMFVAGVLMPGLDMVLRTGGQVRMTIEYMRIATVFLAAAWLALVTSAVLGEAIVRSEHLTIRNFDRQLIRLGTRLAGIMAAVAILIEGGDELGFPAYSVLAGLGVGGLAIALAAQSTIANLIGSLLIALEKPFRVGQYVRIGASEGTVEDVGFRSTRIRTLDDSLVSIPSSSVVNTAVENLSVRSKRRQRFLVQVTYKTPHDQLQDLLAAIRQLLAHNRLVEQGSYQVRLNNFGESSLDILIIFNLQVVDYISELKEREAVLLQIMDLVNQAGAEFAFPTRTLYVEKSGQSEATWGKTEEPALGRWGRK